MNYDIKRSISLYSYQDEYYDGKLDLKGCLRETAKTGAYGVELLAEQMIKQFPKPIEDEAFRERWFALLSQYGLTPSCYDAFLENRIFRNRTLSIGEQINMMKRDLRLAGMLGFPIIRTLVSTPMEVIEGSLEYAEMINVKIGLEVHAPFSMNSGWADGYLEMIRRTGTKYFGFIPDMGIFCRNIPDVVRDKARRQGASEECIR
ncbi:MAG: TIM barrel protein, partial [Parasporobacterium sp.]|nr:TIM barrel protein [Parasporobacterium sp.]